MKKKYRYESELPGRMYRFFISAADDGNLPSFSKFARSIGATLADIERFRQNREFNRAYTECREIRRDLLTDAALTRRFDPSFTKFILGTEFSLGEDKEPDGELSVSIKVSE